MDIISFEADPVGYVDKHRTYRPYFDTLVLKDIPEQDNVVHLVSKRLQGKGL